MSEKFKSFINNFSKFFQRNKKFSKRSFLVIATVVFFVAVSVSVPVHQAHAGLGADAIAKGFEIFIEKASEGGEILLNIIYAVLFLILNLFLDLSIILVKFGAWLIDAVTEPVLYVGNPTAVPPIPGVLTSSTVDIGWKTVRDVCNIFYLFFLLIIAFGTILRSSTFNAKNLLPKLVISLFLINFSAVIAKLVIDFGQVFMYEIMSWMGSFTAGAGSLTSIVDQFSDQLNNFGSKPSFEKVVQVTFALVYSLILGFVYIMLAMFLLVRLVAFVLLIILSPIAFLSIVLPSMAKYTSRWWSELIKYTIFGPIFWFFIYLSATMANELITNYAPDMTTAVGFGIIETIVVLIFPHMIALIMLLAVIPVTQELGMAGSNKIIGGAGGIGKVAMGTYAGVKLAGGLGRRAGGEVSKRSDTVSKKVEGTKQWGYDKMGKIPGMQGAALKGKAGIEKRREDRLKKMEMDFGDLKSIDLKLLKGKADSKLGTTDDKALLLKAAAAQGKLGDPMYEDYMKGAESSMSEKELNEITDKNLNMALQTSSGEERMKEMESGDDGVNKLSKEAKQRIKDKGNTKEAYQEEYLRERMADIVKDGKAHEVQDLDNEMSAKVWHESQDSDQRKSSFSRMNKEDREKLSDGYLKNIQDIKGSDEQQSAIRQDNKEFSSNAAKLGKGLEESFAWGGDRAGEEIKEAFSDFSHKDVAKMSSGDLDKYGHNATKEQMKGLEKAGEYKTVRKIRESKRINDPEGFDRDSNRPTNPTDGESGGESGGGSGGASGGASSGKSGKDKNNYDHSYGFASSKPKQSISENKPVLGQSVLENQGTVEALQKLAKKEGFEEGIDVSEENHGISVGSAGFSGSSSSGDSEGKMDKVHFSPNVIENTKELFETDQEFGEKGMERLIKHEKMHTEGPALEMIEKEEKELEKYSKQEGVSPKDIKKKKKELHEKYHEGGESGAGGEMHAQVQLANEVYEDKEKFIKDEATTHVTADAVYEGMDKIGKIKYGSENPGLHRTHSAFINDKVKDEITERMEEMRQSLVAKHKAKKDAEAGGDETSVGGMDDFMTGSGKGNAEAKTEPQSKRTKAKKAIDSYKGYARTTSPGNVKKKVVDTYNEKMPPVEAAMGKAEIAGLDLVGKFRPTVRAANKVVIPILDEGVKANEEKMAGAKISNKEMRERMAKRLKTEVKSTVSKNAGEGAKAAGDGAGAALKEFGKKKRGKVGAAATVVGTLVENKKFQEIASEEAKKWADQEERKERTANKQSDIKPSAKPKAGTTKTPPTKPKSNK